MYVNTTATLTVLGVEQSGADIVKVYFANGQEASVHAQAAPAAMDLFPEQTADFTFDGEGNVIAVGVDNG